VFVYTYKYSDTAILEMFTRGIDQRLRYDCLDVSLSAFMILHCGGM